LMLFNANLGIPKKQQNFNGLLLRLRNGESILDDWKVLTTRFEGKIDIIENKD
jgi:hypothetical protein